MSIDAPNNRKADVTLPPQTPSPRPTGGANAASSSSQTSTAPAQPATNLDSINIKVGQALQAKVLEVINVVSARTAQNSFNVTLEIGGERLAVKTSIQLQPGQVINLSVNAKGELILPKPTSSDTATLIAGLSKVLPYQQPVGKVISALLQSLPAIGAENNQLKTLLNQLTTLLPKSENFSQGSANTNQSPGLQPNSGQLVKQALSQSGIFMENTLANTAKSASQTLAQNQGLQPTTAQALTQAVKSAISSPLPSASTSTANTSNVSLSAAMPTTLSSPAAAIPQGDLKATISQLIDTLSALYSAKHSPSGRTPQFMAEPDPSLLVSPFNFPAALGGGKSASQPEKELSVGDLLKRLAGALNRIQFQQLNSLYQAQTASSETTSIQTWQIELPFLSPQNQVDSVQVRIDQEKEKSGDKQESEKKSKWKLSLTFDLEELGPMFIQVNLSPPTVSSTIWAENQHTLQLINKEAHNLRESFSELGLTVEEITCRQGQPNMKKTRIDQQIVDIKA
ncbi:flagellar hook-length control protein FliK [Alkalimarinus coralli]|uniref:flagellar hook-length control protein FliK n=1 Tax=Alkalimarinus coralli TaxID=2935863 RepID=UPI00202AD093|nr:flagellar hook-length control protein FliK [Alkalimarinus coralli]